MADQGRQPRSRPPWWPASEPWPPLHTRHHFPGAWGWPFAFLPVLVGFAIMGTLWLVGLLLGGIGLFPDGQRWVPLSRPLFGVLLAVGIGVMVLTIRRTAGPIANILTALERVANGDYTARVIEQGPRRTRALAAAFNKMAVRLQANDEQRRSLIADTTHALLTPITVIQGNLEAMLDGVHPSDRAHLSAVLDESQRLARRVDDLRTLALADAGVLRLHREPTDLAVLIEHTLASFQPQAQLRGVTLLADPAPDLPMVEVDPRRLREIVENLVGNALRHTPTGGSIRVSARASASLMTLSVDDSGAGIRPEEVPHIFERFAKGASSEGMGLGLAIARDLVRAHGGEMTAENVPGGGAMLQITLPLNDH